MSQTLGLVVRVTVSRIAMTWIAISRVIRLAVVRVATACDMNGETGRLTDATLTVVKLEYRSGFMCGVPNAAEGDAPGNLLHVSQRGIRVEGDRQWRRRGTATDGANVRAVQPQMSMRNANLLMRQPEVQDTQEISRSAIGQADSQDRPIETSSSRRGNYDAGIEHLRRGICHREICR